MFIQSVFRFYEDLNCVSVERAKVRDLTQAFSYELCAIICTVLAFLADFASYFATFLR